MVNTFLNDEQTYLDNLKSLLSAGKKTHDIKEDFYQLIVDSPFNDPLAATYLGLGIVVLLLVDDSGKIIQRVALSNTEHAAGAVKTSEKSFKQILIPLNNEKNIISQAIRTSQTKVTEDWKYLFTPALSAASARFNQAGAGIECSIVEPFNYNPHGAALIFSLYQYPTNIERIKYFTCRYAEIVGDVLSRSRY